MYGINSLTELNIPGKLLAIKSNTSFDFFPMLDTISPIPPSPSSFKN